MSDIPRAVSAKTSKALERKMLETQVRLRSFIDWKTIFYNPDDKMFYAWYVVDIDYDEAKKAESKGVNQ